MRRRRIALLAAVITGLAAGAGGLALWPSPTPEPPTHYQVELDLPPVDAALWFVARYPQYFTSGEDGLGAWLDGLHPGDREFVLAMGQTLTWAWVEHELGEFHEQDLDGLAREAMIAVRNKTVNQLEVKLEHFGEVEDMQFVAYLGDPHFGAGVFARLVRGGSNCEGQNHLLALLLDTALEPSIHGRLGLEVNMAGLPSGHELVRVSGPTLRQPMFVDAWSNLPPFTVDPSQPGAAPLLDELGQPTPPLVSGFPARAPESASVYAQTRGVSIVLVPERGAPTKPVDLTVRAPALDEASLARVKDPWRLFLFARVLHIYDDPRAVDLYQLVLERHCNERGRPRTYVCAASSLLSARAGASAR